LIGGFEPGFFFDGFTSLITAWMDGGDVLEEMDEAIEFVESPKRLTFDDGSG